MDARETRHDHRTLCGRVGDLERSNSEVENRSRGRRAGHSILGHIASLLTLAISYAGSTHFPCADADLAIVLLTLGRDAEAEREANVALEQDPNEFRAQQVRVALALNREMIREEHLSSLPPFLSRRELHPGQRFH